MKDFAIIFINIFADCVILSSSSKIFFVSIFFSLSFAVPFSYGKYWEGNKNERMLILRSIVVVSEKNCDAFIFLFFFDSLTI